ncbi:MAG: type IV pilin N-terminal domain-containing protein [Candidatus Thermoplasmatota archaeon]|nr:type IV pilin N-terminal domain-containing protein [Candidatus Thermoplasmatota archaeon]
MKRKIGSKQAVSEVIGVFLLLGITITLFAILNSNVSQFFFGSSIPLVNLIGTIDQKNNMIYIEHNGGESLEGTTDIIITIGSNTYPRNTSDLLIDINNDFKWNFGETLQFNFTGIDITDKYIGVTVIDSNAILLSVVLQKGMS